MNSYEITIGGKQFYFAKPTIEFVKSAQVYAAKIQTAWEKLFSDDGNIEEFEKLWTEFCNHVFQRDLAWKIRFLVFGKLPKELRVSRMEFSPQRVEVREVISFFFRLFGEILKNLNGQLKPSSVSETVEKE